MSGRTQGYKRSAPDGASGGSYHKSKQTKYTPNGGSGGAGGGGARSGGYQGKSYNNNGGNSNGGSYGGGGGGTYGGGGSGGYKGKGGQQGGYKGKGPAGGGYKGKAAAKPEDDGAAAGKRKRPITQGGGEEDVDMSDDDAEEDEAMEGEEGDGASGEAGGPQEKRPRMTKAEKAALHAAQPHRTALLPSYTLLQELLPLWEPARRADIPKEERKKAVDDLWAAAKGRVAEISKGHKGTRILQTVVKHGGKEERTGVAMELRPQWRAMMESKYAKFLMRKLIRYCPSIRPLLIEDLTPALPHLLTHADAVQPLSDFYDLYASAKERRALVRGLYPKEVRLTSSSTATVSGEDDVQGLDVVLEGMANEQGRLRILEGVEKTVLNVFNATQKAALNQAIYHRLVREYLDCIYRFLDAESADKKMHELLTASLESLADIVHTKDGSSVARELLVRGNAKDRKQILQHLRKHIPAMSKDADAQLVLFTAFDCVDDTKLMGKTFVADIVGTASELVFDKIGRRSVLYLLVPDSTVHFIAPTLNSLSESAQKAREIGTSKKDPVTRRKELLSSASPGLLAAVQEKGAEMVRDPGAGLVVQEIMLRTEGDKAEAVAALAKPLETPYPEEPESTDSGSELDNETAYVWDLPHATRTYKTVLSGGKFKMKTQTLEVMDDKLPARSASAFWDALVSEDAGGADNAARVAAQGSAALVIVEMIAGLKKAGRVEEVKKVLSKKEVLSAIEEGGKKGSAVLLETLRAL